MFDIKCTKCDENYTEIERLKNYKFDLDSVVIKTEWEILKRWSEGYVNEGLVQKIVEKINAVQLKKD